MMICCQPRTSICFLLLKCCYCLQVQNRGEPRYGVGAIQSSVRIPRTGRSCAHLPSKFEHGCGLPLDGRALHLATFGSWLHYLEVALSQRTHYTITGKSLIVAHARCCGWYSATFSTHNTDTSNGLSKHKFGLAKFARAAIISGHWAGAHAHQPSSCSHGA
ncbi:unnamed protein product [Prunus armeniaca]|uniref:Secreted protein n=1 Tax=Prunus armeniaca TaxID=36596 RepID=A0A6J5U8C7_PRUAR|nr:unnamed protein product [Prunus armeniaca]